MKHAKDDFFISNNQFHAANDFRHPVCKECLKKDLDYNNIESICAILRELDRPFLFDLWQKTLQESEVKKKEPFGLYIKNVQLAYKGYTYKDSIFEPTEDSSMQLSENEMSDNAIIQETSNKDSGIVFSELDLKNKDYVIRHVGYDPFEYEREEDKRNLYNKLVDYLDDSTLEDPFKLPAVIEIVRTFNQIDKINAAIAAVDTRQIANNTGGLKGLIDAKSNLLKSILQIAKDNGISVNYNNNKSKGAGTLSGIIKQLHEIGIDTAEINLFDIETCEGMKQVADISNRSILEQLMLNESDYTEMIAEQRKMIVEMQEKIEKLEEENRLLKLKIKHYENDGMIELKQVGDTYQ